MKMKDHLFTYKRVLPLVIGLMNYLFICDTVTAQVPPIGQWREHLNYQQTIQVIKGDRLYCAATKALFSIDDKNEPSRYSKVTGLNDIGVRCIGWDATTSQLIIAYNNSNIDLLKGSIVYNIRDIASSTIAGDKSIQQIFCQDGLAYLSSGLGIIVADLTRREIKDTWIIGNNGTQVKVNAFTIHNNLFYAATEDGLKTTSANINNPANYRNWILVSGNHQLPSGSIKNVIVANNNIIVQKGDSLFIQNGTNWQLLYHDVNWPIVSITPAGNQFTVCQRTASGSARVLIMNTNGTIARTISAGGIISFPLSAIVDNGQIWVADRFGGLSRTGNATDRFIPNGPPGVATGELASNGNITVAAAGSVNDAWNYLFNRDGFYLLKENTWSSKSFFNTPVLDSVLDFITITIDPRDEAVWAGSYGGGLVRFANDQFSIFKQNNSSLRAAIGDPGSIRVSGLAFDSKQQLWVANYGAAQNLSVRKRDNSWKSFSIPFTHTENALSQLITDDLDQIWAMSPKGNGLFCFNPGNDIDNIADDRWKYYRQGAGNGNLPSSNVYSIVKDRDGSIWVGTDRGIGIIRCPESAFTPAGCEAIQPIVQQDRFAGLLFRDEVVQCMAVDGANRKWVGTRNGLWLLSSNGEKVIYRFTAENSPLLSNDVRKLSIDPVNGELFIATFEGLCSFRSTATTPVETQSKVLVFPNPVPPSFNGTIAIRGLVDKALVKITELNGRLVYQTRSLGGQAIWDGRNYLGAKVASGVYLVLIRDDSGQERIATKIVITSNR
ncbi:two-component regulator propeller domain-containing protein [Sediminibacterium sp. KACHI17]